MSITEDVLKERSTAPRVTLDQINVSIYAEYYFTAAQGIAGRYMTAGGLIGRSRSLEHLTFCVLVLDNGFTVTGQSACVDPKNYQRDIGECIARQDAINKIWPLLGYELRTQLYEEALK